MHFYFIRPVVCFTINLLLVLIYVLNQLSANTKIMEPAVLATRDFIKVEQRKPYGDILISRGRKMCQVESSIKFMQVVHLHYK